MASSPMPTPPGGRWRVIPSPGDRLPGTFDQDVYVELLRRFQEAGEPPDGVITFTLHAFLRAMGRRVDGRTYEQLRGALGRLERTTLESHRHLRAGERHARGSALHPAHLGRRRATAHPGSRAASALQRHHDGRARRRARRPLGRRARQPRRESHHQHLGALLLGPRLAGRTSPVSPARGRSRRRPAHLASRPGSARSAAPARPALSVTSPARAPAGPRHARGAGCASKCRRSATSARLVRRLRAGLAASLNWSGQPERPRRRTRREHFRSAGRIYVTRLPLHAESFMLRRRSALLAAALLPVVAGGFLYQNRATTDGARVLDQVLQLVSHALRRHRQPGRPLREGGARPREGAQRSVQRAVHTEGARELLAADQRQVRRHRHADRGAAGRDHDQPGLPAHAGGSCRRARGRPHRLRRHALHAWLEDAAGLRLSDRRARHEGHREVPAAGRPGAHHEHVHAAGDSHPRRAVRDRARQQDRLRPRAALQRDGHGGGAGRRRAAHAARA